MSFRFSANDDNIRKSAGRQISFDIKNRFPISIKTGIQNAARRKNIRRHSQKKKCAQNKQFSFEMAHIFSKAAYCQLAAHSYPDVPDSLKLSACKHFQDWRMNFSTRACRFDIDIYGNR